MQLETERLLLRKPERSDIDGYMKVFGDPEVTRFLGRGGARTREEVSNGVDLMIGHWEQHGIGLFTVRRRDDDLLLGRVGFLLWDEERWVNAMFEDPQGPTETELGWTLAHAHWNQGYATEGALACRDWAFEERGLTRLVSVIAPDNLGSIRVAEKIGETLEREDLPGPFVRRVDLYSLGSKRV